MIPVPVKRNGGMAAGRRDKDEAIKPKGPTSGGPAPGGRKSGGPQLGGPRLGGPRPGGPRPGRPVPGGPVPGRPVLGGPAPGGLASEGPAPRGLASEGPAPRGQNPARSRFGWHKTRASKTGGSQNELTKNGEGKLEVPKPEGLKLGRLRTGELKIENIKSGEKKQEASKLGLLKPGFYQRGGLQSGEVITRSLRNGGTKTGNTNTGDVTSAALKPAPFKSEPLKTEPLQLAPLKLAPLNAAPIRHAPLKPAPFRPAPLRLTPLWPAPLKHSPLKSSPLRLAPLNAGSHRLRDVESEDGLSGDARTGAVKSGGRPSQAAGKRDGIVGISFGTLAFDWFVVAMWDFESKESTESQGYQHLTDFQGQNDRTRQGFEDCAASYRKTGRLPRKVDQSRVARVPHDVLTDQERRFAALPGQCCAVVRTAYGEKADEAYRNLARALETEDVPVFSDALRYNARDWRDVICYMQSLFLRNDRWSFSAQGEARSWVIVFDQEAARTAQPAFFFLGRTGEPILVSERRLPGSTHSLQMVVEWAGDWGKEKGMSWFDVLAQVDDFLRARRIGPSDERRNQILSREVAWKEEVLRRVRRRMKRKWRL